MSDLHNDSSPTVIYQRMVPADAFTRIAELEAENARLLEVAKAAKVLIGRNNSDDWFQLNDALNKLEETK